MINFLYACIYSDSHIYLFKVHNHKIEIQIKWDQLIEFQYKCLKNGLNGVGIPDLIIAQNAKQNHCEIYSLDNHFKLIKDIVKIKLTA